MSHCEEKVTAQTTQRYLPVLRKTILTSKFRVFQSNLKPIWNFSAALEVPEGP